MEFSHLTMVGGLYPANGGERQQAPRTARPSRTHEYSIHSQHISLETQSTNKQLVTMEQRSRGFLVSLLSGRARMVKASTKLTPAGIN